MIDNPGRAAILVLALAAPVCLIYGAGQYWNDSEEERYLFHHEIAADADPAIGMDTIPKDYMVEEDFTSHLPLVILDPHGQEIVNYKYYDAQTDSFRYQDGIDPYTDVTVKVVDNKNHVNTPADPATIASQGRIKIRGNSSSALPKSQYRLQLLDEDGNKADFPLLGLDKAAEWVLNGSLRDSSYLRNYLGYNLGHMMDAYSPEVRFCEVLMKTEGGYRYEGLYLLIEAIDKGEGRIELQGYNPDRVSGPYVVRRDRVDESEVRIFTYADEMGMAEEWSRNIATHVQLSLIYPKEKKVTPETLAYISDDISLAERIIYSDNPNAFRQYASYIDVDSFVNYFIINEFMMSYDAGVHSTYMYKDTGGKLTMGPYWDFDGGIDNAGNSMANFEYIPMYYRPYYDRLCEDAVFRNRLWDRYVLLREGILSDENMLRILSESSRFLGKAVERDRQRWHDYSHSLSVLQEESTKLFIDRNRQSYEDELTRMQDALILHAHYLDEHLNDRDYIVADHAGRNVLAALFLLGFFVSIVLVQRARKM